MIINDGKDFSGTHEKFSFQEKNLTISFQKKSIKFKITKNDDYIKITLKKY